MALALAGTLFVGCGHEDTSAAGAGGTGGGTGGKGGTGGCLVQPEPTFVLHVSNADGGPVPPDTTVEVMWSAGTEIPFQLDEPDSWGTLETSNLACDVDPNADPPADLETLSCVLWTSSPTQVRVTAKGYVTVEDTYSEMPSTECEKEPTPIDVVLEPEHS